MDDRKKREVQSMTNQFLWGAGLMMLAASCSYRLSEHPTSGDCAPWKVADRGYYVAPEVYRRVPSADNVAAAWGMRPVEREKAGVIVEPGTHASMARITTHGPIVIKMGTDASPVTLSHEFCHAAWRSTCHAERGICARRVSQDQDWQPTQRDLNLWEAE